MTDPREQDEQAKDDQQFGSKHNEQDAIKELDIRSDDAENVKGGRAEDPCAGGQIRKR